ncbi:MAG: hypothetical protein ACREN6_08840, partial [Gemmatimonadaceae bacterium]
YSVQLSGAQMQRICWKTDSLYTNASGQQMDHRQTFKVDNGVTGTIVAVYWSDDCQPEAYDDADGSAVGGPFEADHTTAMDTCLPSDGGDDSGGGTAAGGGTTWCAYLDWYDQYGNLVEEDLLGCWQETD